MTTRRAYTTDLTNAQWKRIEPRVPQPKAGGRPATVERREVVNAILYVARNGIPWRALPHDFPRWQTVYHSFRIWRDDGFLRQAQDRLWERIHDALRDDLRKAAGRDPSPSAAILDAQSVKMAETGYPRAGGGSAVGMTLGRKSRGANAILPSIRLACCSPSS